MLKSLCLIAAMLLTQQAAFSPRGTEANRAATSSTISFVQASSNATGTSACSFTGVGANHLLVCFLQSNGTYTGNPTVSDSGTCTGGWHQIGSTVTDVGSVKMGAAFYCGSASSGTHTVTVTVPGSPYITGLGVEGSRSGSLDTSGGSGYAESGAYTTTQTTGAFTVSSGDWLVGMCGEVTSSSTVGSGYTIRVIENNYESSLVEDGSASNSSATITCTNPGNNYAFIIGAAFH